MNQTLIQRYENSCLMLMDQRADGFHFLGTAFILHPQGYLLTSDYILSGAEKPMAVSAAQPGDFTPLTAEDGLVFETEIARRDPQRGLALLKIEVPSDIGAPDDFIGNPEQVGEGTPLLTFGVSFGHFRIHNVMVIQSMVSAKVLSHNGTKLFIFDSAVHPGDIGGPIVNGETGRILGIIAGLFNPLEIQQLEQPEDYTVDSRFSYAVSIEYGKDLLENAGIEHTQPGASF